MNRDASILKDVGAGVEGVEGGGLKREARLAIGGLKPQILQINMYYIFIIVSLSNYMIFIVA